MELRCGSTASSLEVFGCAIVQASVPELLSRVPNLRASFEVAVSAGGEDMISLYCELSQKLRADSRRVCPRAATGLLLFGRSKVATDKNARHRWTR